MTAKKKPQGSGKSTGASNKNRMQTEFHCKSPNSQAQRERIVAALRRQPQSTEDLRKIGIFVVAARVKELRDRFGYRIETIRVNLTDREDYPHPRMAVYCLRSEPEGAA